MSDFEVFGAYISLYYCTEYLLFYSINFHFLSFSFYFCNFLFPVESMSDEIQPVIVGSGTDIATDTGVHNNKNNGNVRTVHPECEKWTVAKVKADSTFAFVAMRIIAMFPGVRNKTILDRWGT